MSKQRNERKLLITGALLYLNGPAHLGHVRSTYLFADIYARFSRMRGYDVCFVSGGDCFGSPVAIQAELENTNPIDIVKKYYKASKKNLEDLGISFDIYSYTAKDVHYELTSNFFNELFEGGHIYEKEVEQFYCPKCERSLPDRYVGGVCPYCGAEGARGDHCEACGRHLEPFELHDPYCMTCRSVPEARSANHYFFRLSAFQNELERWVEENENLPANVRNYALQWLKEGLHDWDITRDMEWGVPIPIKEAEGKVLYVWFDAPIGYVTFTKEWAQKIGEPEKWKEYWMDKNSKIIHVIGKDIVVHHTLFWPAMLMGHGEYNLPWTIIAGEFMTLEGEKMSTSRGWVVWLSDYLEKHDPDALRYYLTISAPITRDTDFSWDEYLKRYNDELADILGNFVHRVLSFIYRFYDGEVPAPKADYDALDKEAIEKIESVPELAAELLDKFKIRAGLREIMDFAKFGNKYFNDKEPWITRKTKPDVCGTTLFTCANIVHALTVLLAPYCPFVTAELWEMLGKKGKVHNVSWSEASKLAMKPGQKIKEPRPLFPKISDEIIKEEKKILKERLATAEND